MSYLRGMLQSYMSVYLKVVLQSYLTIILYNAFLTGVTL